MGQGEIAAKHADPRTQRRADEVRRHVRFEERAPHPRHAMRRILGADEDRDVVPGELEQ